MRKLLLLVAFLLVPAIAQAVPLQLAHHGQLLDSDGDPVTGTQNITFRLWDADTGGNSVWSEVISVDVVSGHYSALLNLGEVGRDTLRDEPSLWLELEIGGSPLLPRQPVAATPYALVADTAENVVGGTVDAASIAVNGTTVVDGSGNWAGGAGSIHWSALWDMPPDADTLADLGMSCADQSVAKWDDGGGQWVCATDLVLTSGEVLGMVDGATVNLGTGSQVAGVDIATLDDITWGTLSGIPGGFADGIDDDTDTVLTDAQVLGMVDGATVNLGAGSQMGAVDLATVDDLAWGSLTGIPGGFADGVDDDALAVLGATCVEGERPTWNATSSAWVCEAGVTPATTSDFYLVSDSASANPGEVVARALCNDTDDIVVMGSCSVDSLSTRVKLQGPTYEGHAFSQAGGPAWSTGAVRSGWGCRADAGASSGSDVDTTATAICWTRP